MVVERKLTEIKREIEFMQCKAVGTVQESTGPKATGPVGHLASTVDAMCPDSADST